MRFYEKIRKKKRKLFRTQSLAAEKSWGIKVKHHSRVSPVFLLIHNSQVLALGHMNLELTVLLIIVQCKFHSTLGIHTPKIAAVHTEHTATHLPGGRKRSHHWNKHFADLFSGPTCAFLEKWSAPSVFKYYCILDAEMVNICSLHKQGFEDTNKSLTEMRYPITGLRSTDFPSAQSFGKQWNITSKSTQVLFLSWCYLY